MRVAIVHDWLVVFGGAERVLKELLHIYRDADVYSLVDFLSDADRAAIGLSDVKTSFIQRLPRARRRYRSYLALMPLAIEQFDLTSYDLVISSSYAVSKGVITGPDQLHVSYVHSPIRYAWDLQHTYLREAGISGLSSVMARLILHYIRLWDVRTTHGPDHIIANSKFVARRIRKVYGRAADVIYPPVDIDKPVSKKQKGSFYLVVSRLVPYKKVALIVDAFTSSPARSLVVIGDGPDLPAIKSRAGPNVTMLGYQADEVVRDYMSRAAAFVIAAEEDFGITAVEAQACGTPVICFYRGGSSETVIDVKHSEPTGVFFEDQTTTSILAACDRFERSRERFVPEVLQRNAMRFSRDRFRSQMQGYIAAKMAEFREEHFTPESHIVHETSATPQDLISIDHS